MTTKKLRRILDNATLAPLSVGRKVARARDCHTLAVVLAAIREYTIRPK